MRKQLTIFTLLPLMILFYSILCEKRKQQWFQIHCLTSLCVLYLWVIVVKGKWNKHIWWSSLLPLSSWIFTQKNLLVSHRFRQSAKCGSRTKIVESKIAMISSFPRFAELMSRPNLILPYFWVNFCFQKECILFPKSMYFVLLNNWFVHFMHSFECIFYYRLRKQFFGLNWKCVRMKFCFLFIIWKEIFSWSCYSF